MADRWRILALLFAVRTTMALQFESVAAFAPLVRRDYGVSLADIGLLIGLYFVPGIFFALPGGAVGRRFGDKRVVILGLAMMVAGGTTMAIATSWNAQLAGRLVAGIGGVFLNVLMSKMVQDWFSGREMTTAMAIFVNSWPFGIAAGLLLLPALAQTYGVGAAHALCAGLAALGLVALVVSYRPPPATAAGSAPQVPQATAGWPAGTALACVVIAGLIWGLYNAGLGMVFGYGPSLLAERGWSVAASGSVTSIALWLSVVSVLLGGLLADRTGWVRSVLVVGVVAFAVTLAMFPRSEAAVAILTVGGLLGGLAAGPIMTLPAQVLSPEKRAVGMGVFFTVFYLVTVTAPWVAGVMAAHAGSARITFDLGAALQITCLPLLWLFDRMRTTGAA